MKSSEDSSKSTECEPLRKPHKDCLSDTDNVSNKYIIEKVDNKPCTHHDVHLVPPDGGWGWMVVLGSVITMIISTMPIFGFGILFSPILMSSDVSSSIIAWIFNVYSLIWCIGALLIGPLHEEFGWRKVSITGGIFTSSAIIISAFAPSAQFLFFSFSILGGIGGSMAVTTAFIVISRYFVERRGFALGMASLGSCVSAFITPLIANYLLENYGYRGASLIFGSIVLNQCIGGALFQPVEWHMKSEPVETCLMSDGNLTEPLNQHDSSDEVSYEMLQVNRTQNTRKLSTDSIHSSVSLKQMEMDSTHLKRHKISQDHEAPKPCQPRDKGMSLLLQKLLRSSYDNLKTLKLMRVVLISFGSASLILGYTNFQMWIPFVVTNAGHSLEMAAWCASAASIANIVGRIAMSILSDKRRFNIQYANILGTLLVSTSIFAFSVVEDIRFFLIFMCSWGLGVGICMCLNSIIIISIMGVELYPAVFGICSLINGVIGIIFGPIVGVIRDSTSSYMYALWLLGGAVMVSFCLWLSMPLAIKYDRRKSINVRGESRSP